MYSGVRELVAQRDRVPARLGDAPTLQPFLQYLLLLLRNTLHLHLVTNVATPHSPLSCSSLSGNRFAPDTKP